MDALRADLADLSDWVVEPFVWSGLNSAFERERAGVWLADHLRLLRERYDELHLIAHSHGGNVALAACERLRWKGDQARHGLCTVATVGTPFLRGRTGIIRALVAVLLLLAALTALSLVTVRYAAEFADAADRADMLGSGDGNKILFYLFAVVSAAFVVAVALGLWRSFRAGVARVHFGSRLLAIWHPNDEAISFLRHVHAAPIEPFARGALVRATRNGAVLAGAGSTVVFGGLVATWPGFAEYVERLTPLPALLIEAPAIGDFVVLMPAAFLAGYWSFRFVFGFLPDALVRRKVNASLSGILKGLALGADTDVRFDAPECAPPGKKCIAVELDGEVARRMHENASVRTDELLRKYRGAIFSVDYDAQPLFGRIAVDALTWNALVHTTYFGQPEVVARISAHMRENHRAREA